MAGISDAPAAEPTLEPCLKLFGIGRMGADEWTTF
jgi:hypothetical protein